MFIFVKNIDKYIFKHKYICFVLNIFLFLLSKLHIFIEKMEEKTKILTTEGVISYYKSLVAHDRKLFLRYLLFEYDFAYSTLINKLNCKGRFLFNKRDLAVITNVIRQELWRQ